MGFSIRDYNLVRSRECVRFSECPLRECVRFSECPLREVLLYTIHYHMMQYIIYIIQYNTQYTNNRQYNTRRIKEVKKIKI